MVERWDELYGYQSQALPRQAKSRIWNDIAARLSGSSWEAREGEDVRRKWLYVKLTLRNRLRAAGQLGLGAYPPDLSPLEQRVLALMGHDSGGSVDAPDIGFGKRSGTVGALHWLFFRVVSHFPSLKLLVVLHFGTARYMCACPIRAL